MEYTVEEFFGTKNTESPGLKFKRSLDELIINPEFTASRKKKRVYQKYTPTQYLIDLMREKPLKILALEYNLSKKVISNIRNGYISAYSVVKIADIIGCDKEKISVFLDY